MALIVKSMNLIVANWDSLKRLIRSFNLIWLGKESF